MHGVESIVIVVVVIVMGSLKPRVAALGRGAATEGIKGPSTRNKKSTINLK